MTKPSRMTRAQLQDEVRRMHAVYKKHCAAQLEDAQALDTLRRELEICRRAIVEGVAQYDASERERAELIRERDENMDARHALAVRLNEAEAAHEQYAKERDADVAEMRRDLAAIEADIGAARGDLLAAYKAVVDARFATEGAGRDAALAEAKAALERIGGREAFRPKPLATWAIAGASAVAASLPLLGAMFYAKIRGEKEGGT